MTREKKIELLCTIETLKAQLRRVRVSLPELRPDADAIDEQAERLYHLAHVRVLHAARKQ